MTLRQKKNMPNVKKTLHDRLLAKGWKFYSRLSEWGSDGFYQKVVDNDAHFELVKYDYTNYPQINMPTTYELEVYLDSWKNFTGEAVKVKVYSWPEKKVDPDKIEKIAREIIRRLRSGLDS